jgi:hypothetical protein
MKTNNCGKCVLFSYLSYVCCFFCMVIRDCVIEWYKKWKNSLSTSGFNDYEIIPKHDENIIGTTYDNNQLNTMETQIDFKREEVRTINLNESTSSILKKWTMRPNISESINEDQPI